MHTQNTHQPRHVLLLFLSVAIYSSLFSFKMIYGHFCFNSRGGWLRFERVSGCCDAYCASPK